MMIDLLVFCRPAYVQRQTKESLKFHPKTRSKSYPSQNVVVERLKGLQRNSTCLTTSRPDSRELQPWKKVPKRQKQKQKCQCQKSDLAHLHQNLWISRV